MIARRVDYQAFELPYHVYIRKDVRLPFELEGRYKGLTEAEDAASLEVSRGNAVTSEVRHVISRWEAGDV